MNLLAGLNMQEIAMVAGRRMVLPGSAEPQWLQLAIEHERAIAEIRAERRAMRPGRPVRIVRRLRTVLARS